MQTVAHPARSRQSIQVRIGVGAMIIAPDLDEPNAYWFGEIIRFGDDVVLCKGVKLGGDPKARATTFRVARESIVGAASGEIVQASTFDQI